MAHKVLIFIVAYNHETTIQEVLSRIPPQLSEHETEVLIIDDSSQDDTFGEAEAYRGTSDFNFRLTVLRNTVNQGYGGNQKIGFQYAIENSFDVVALVHGDGQYAPEKLPDLIAPVLAGEADAVFGSRMMIKGGARRGGMPLYKYVGNKILSTFQNLVLGSSLTEFHSGYRIYGVDALRRIPFYLNTNVFHFDTEIIIQLILGGFRIKELPIPTYYGDEICNVDGLVYAKDVFKATAVVPFHRAGLLFQRKYDLAPDTPAYESKTEFDSTHSRVIAAIPRGSSVLDIGCGTGTVATALQNKECVVSGVDGLPPELVDGVETYYQVSLDNDPLPVAPSKFDYVLLLDVIEHLKDPESFVEALYESLSQAPDTQIIATTGNVAFGPVRLMLMLGMFNYGKRGILDYDHSRLFTLSSFRRLFEERGFNVTHMSGVPAPFQLAVKSKWLANGLSALNKAGIRIWKRFFAFQVFIHLKPKPSLDWLLAQARQEAEKETRKAS